MPVVDSYATWLRAGSFSVEWGFQLDQLSMVMLLVVTGVGFLIHVYSTGYMAEDENYGRFFTYLNLFVFSMLMLVLGNNYLVMYVGWELVGLCSFLLISFWFTKPSAAAAPLEPDRVHELALALANWYPLNPSKNCRPLAIAVTSC